MLECFLKCFKWFSYNLKDWYIVVWKSAWVGVNKTWYIQSVWIRTLNNINYFVALRLFIAGLWTESEVWLRPTGGSAGITLQKAVFWTESTVMWCRLAWHKRAYFSNVQDIPWILRFLFFTELSSTRIHGIISQKAVSFGKSDIYSTFLILLGWPKIKTSSHFHHSNVLTTLLSCNHSSCCLCIVIVVYVILLVVYVLLLLSMYSYCSSMYSYRCLCILIFVYVFLDAATLTEVFPCFFLGCKANARV